MTPARRRHLTRFLRMFMREVRWVFRRRQAAASAMSPDLRMCRNCAFNPATDSHQGFESTAYGLLQALRENRPFFCHAGMPFVEGVGWVPPQDTSKLRFCAGWATVADFGPGKTVGDACAERAAARAGTVPA